ncbi:MAG: hypothetical protein P4L56_03795 [Candidatus Sulfopaludibacter sp.]|nr:hypothetical protein [Candidatus Sulfopaludibacter sp.]
MSQTLAVCLLAMQGAMGFAAAETRTVTLEGASAEQKWALKDLNPGLRADWSGFDYLVLEFRASSPQRFQLRLYTTDGNRNAGINPFPGTWIRAALPLSIFTQQSRSGSDMASVSNRSRPSYYLNLNGPYGPLTSVEAIGIAMQVPLGKPTFELRSVRLAKESPGDAVLEPKPLVDELGQWIHAEHRTLDQVKREWAREDQSLRAGDFGYCRYGGFAATKAKATGFFRVEKVDGKWWFVDPDGHLFYSTGVDCVRSEMGTRTEGRDGVYMALPPAELQQGSMASFYTWNLLRRFGAEWKNKWPDLAARRMSAWGINTVANWSDPVMFGRQKAYVVQLSGLGMDVGWLGLPDVYAAGWAARVDAAVARQCDPRKEDPWLLGYFMANEPPWPGREQLIADMILKAPETATQRELKAWLAESDTAERRKSFIEHAFEKYVDVIAGAMRKHDPNHLNLGMRFAGDPSPAMIQASKKFDVYSLNAYDYAPNPARLQRISDATGLPMLIGEFHIGTPGRGMAPGLRQARSEAERGVAYRYYVENAAAFPAMTGTHWFQWLDEPVTGRMDGENYNIGMVDVTDIPYPGLLEGVVAAHRRLFEVHSGKEPPSARKPEAQ